MTVKEYFVCSRNGLKCQLMLSDAANKKFDALIVWKTDRIGRNKEEIALDKYHLKKNGVKIYYVAEMIPDTPEGIILEAVIEGMAAYYSEQLSQNIKRGQRASALKVQSTGGNRPLGYLTGPDKKFVIDPKSAPTVKLVFDLYAQGQTVSQIVRELNSRGSTPNPPKFVQIYSLYHEAQVLVLCSMLHQIKADQTPTIL